MKKINILFFLGWIVSAVCYASTPDVQQYSYYPYSRTLQDLSSAQISQIIKHGAWKTMGQTITSAKTNNDSYASPQYDNIAKGDNAAGVNAFADITFAKDVKRVLDVGGGKFDVCRNYMHTKGIELLVWDPYNRSIAHNARIQQEVSKQKVDAATSMAVLNVISDPEVRLAHIVTLKQALKPNGYAYFKVWPGEGKLKGSYKPTLGYLGYQSNAYANKFLEEVQLVFGKNNARLDPVIPNLIVAKNVS